MIRLFGLILLIGLCLTVEAQEGTLLSSTSEHYMVETRIQLVENPAGNVVEIDPEAILHEIEGFGTAVSEKGWQALSYLEQAQRDALLKAILNPLQTFAERLQKIAQIKRVLPAC